MAIDYCITENNEVILQNAGPGNEQELSTFLRRKHVAYAFFEYTNDPQEAIIRWLIFDLSPHGVYFVDGSSVADFFESEDEDDEIWLERRLFAYAWDVRDGIGPSRELDYEAGRAIHGTMQWFIMTTACNYEAGSQTWEELCTSLKWLPGMRTIISTMADRYLAEDPYMEENFNRHYREFTTVLKRRFGADVDVPDHGKLLVTFLSREQYVDIVASTNASCWIFPE